MSDHIHNAAARAVDHAADALRFAEEAQMESARGDMPAARKFVQLALQSFDDARRELREVAA